MDLSLEAIENDLRNAEQQAGRPAMQLHLTQANIRATLLAASAGKPKPTPVEPVESASPFVSGSNDVAIQRHPLGSVYIVPVAASNADRREIAADILGVPIDYLATLLTIPLPSVVPESTEALIVAADGDDSDVDDDFFADVRKGRRK